MSDLADARIRRRYAAERRFKALGLAAVLFSGLVLAFLLVTMTANAMGGFKRAELAFPIEFSGGVLTVDPAQLQGPGALSALQGAGLADVVAYSAAKAAGDQAAAQLEGRHVVQRLGRLVEPLAQRGRAGRARGGARRRPPRASSGGGVRSTLLSLFGRAQEEGV